MVRIPPYYYTTSFNGAAPVRTRIEHFRGFNPFNNPSFNGAAPVRTRIEGGRGFGGSSTSASMGPRL